MQTHINFAEIEKLFSLAHSLGRTFLFEHEVYDLVQATGGETPPKFLLLKKNTRLTEGLLQKLPGDRVVIKVVSPSIAHKSDVGGVCIAAKQTHEVISAIRRMSCEIPLRMAEYIAKNPMHDSPFRDVPASELEKSIADGITGYLLCQYMHPDSLEFGNELLISLRNSREFGLVISAGLGGRDTELYAARFRRGQAIVSASTEQVDGEIFFQLFTKTISYKKMAGLTRGQKRIVTDEQLLECFSAFIKVAQRFSPTSTTSPFVIEELEINPFAFSNYLMMPLDGLCRFSLNKITQSHRPQSKMRKLLHPSSIGIIGISAKKMNIGRLIAHNILANGYPAENLLAIHPEVENIDGIVTCPSLETIQDKLDLLILAVEARKVPSLIETLLKGNIAECVLLISGGLGEHEEQRQLMHDIQKKIAEARRQESDSAPIFLGANSLGILSHPGHYDAMFIPESKLPKCRSPHPRTLALVSQSGAYMITRMSKLSFLDPAFAISIGNQLDISASDFMHFLKNDDALRTIAFYMEGFNTLDGLAFCEAVRQAVPKGKEIIVYKAGRTPEGKNALAGHTASIAGEYMVCESCIEQAGAMIAETFTMFEGLLRLSVVLHDKKVWGNRLAAISNAGYEAVGIADNILGEDYELNLALLNDDTCKQLHNILDRANLSFLAKVHNPLDITPMASDDVYIETIKALLCDTAVDVVIAAIVPLSPMLHTLPIEIAFDEQHSRHHSIVTRIGELGASSDKPLVIVVDSGSLYDYLADGLQSHGLPVFRSADIAVSALGKYINNRLSHHRQESAS